MFGTAHRRQLGAACPGRRSVEGAGITARLLWHSRSFAVTRARAHTATPPPPPPPRPPAPPPRPRPHPGRAAPPRPREGGGEGRRRGGIGRRGAGAGLRGGGGERTGQAHAVRGFPRPHTRHDRCPGYRRHPSAEQEASAPRGVPVIGLRTRCCPPFRVGRAPQARWVSSNSRETAGGTPHHHQSPAHQTCIVPLPPHPRETLRERPHTRFVPECESGLLFATPGPFFLLSAPAFLKSVHPATWLTTD